MPGSKRSLVLGGFEVVFDGPAVALHGHQLFHGCINQTPCGEEREIASTIFRRISSLSCPDTGECGVEIIGIEVGQFEIDPITQSRPFGLISCQLASPGIVKASAMSFAVPATANGLSHERKR